MRDIFSTFSIDALHKDKVTHLIEGLERRKRDYKTYALEPFVLSCSPSFTHSLTHALIHLFVHSLAHLIATQNIRVDTDQID